MIKFQSLNKYTNVWLTSDSHYQHRNICRGTSTWWDSNIPESEQRGSYQDFLDSTRDFETIESMNQALVDGINNNVGKNDVLVHCGDWSFGGAFTIGEFYDRINCKNVVLTPGNHDNNIRDREGFKSMFQNVVPINDMQYLQWKGNRFMVSHYPILVWHQSHKEVPLAFGHVHGSNPGIGKSLDVGVDNAFKIFGEYRPFSIDEFLHITSAKETYLESHHNSKTS